MEYQENIIQIRKRDIRQADLAFDDFKDNFYALSQLENKDETSSVEEVKERFDKWLMKKN